MPLWQGFYVATPTVVKSVVDPPIALVLKLGILTCFQTL